MKGARCNGRYETVANVRATYVSLPLNCSAPYPHHCPEGCVLPFPFQSGEKADNRLYHTIGLKSSGSLRLLPLYVGVEEFNGALHCCAEVCRYIVIVSGVYKQFPGFSGCIQFFF